MKVARLFQPFHIPGKYEMMTYRDDDGSEFSAPVWRPGADHSPGACFHVHRVGPAHGIYGIEDGIAVALCYRETRPATDDMIGEAEILAIPVMLLKITEEE